MPELVSLCTASCDSLFFSLFSLPSLLSLPSTGQSLKDGSGGAEGLVSQKQKIKVEAERLDVVDKAAGVLAELLFDVNILQQIKDYRSLFLVVCKKCH